MTDQQAPLPPAPGSEPGGASPGYPRPSPTQQLEQYFAAHSGRGYTEEALASAARSAGYSGEEIDAALVRTRAAAAAGPVRERARRTVLWAYFGTFLVLTVLMGINNPGAIVIGVAVLAVTLLIALGISLLMLRGVGPATTIAVAMTGPVVLLLVVAGACFATGLPLSPLRF